MKTITLALLVALSLTASFALAEELPPWMSYVKPENNNPFDYSAQSSFPNGNAGYAGSELPPSDYQPDARSREYQRERLEQPESYHPSSEQTSGRNPWCFGAYCDR